MSFHFPAAASAGPVHIVSLGECMIEIGGQPLRRRYGGDTLNTAIYLARLLQGWPAEVHYATALGDDPLSDGLLSQWQDEGLFTERVARLPGRAPGLYLIETDDRGERRFFYWRNDSAARHYFSGELDFATLLNPALKACGASLNAVSGPRRRAWRYRRTAKPSPLSSVTRCALTTSMPANFTNVRKGRGAMFKACASP